MAFTFGMIFFDDMTNLDFSGPADIFSRVPGSTMITLSKTRAPVCTDSGGRLLADITLAEAPPIDLVFIGGGPGTLPLMNDPVMLGFLRERAEHAQWVTSVCTGALVLGAAGLLRGYNAATHWTAMSVLPLLGATPVHERVVIDRNRITGGGVTAGIDFGLTVVAKIWGDERAQLIQLGMEYNPQPPYNAGSPETAPPHLVARFRERAQGVLDQRLAAAAASAERLDRVD